MAYQQRKQTDGIRKRPGTDAQPSPEPVDNDQSGPRGFVHRFRKSKQAPASVVFPSVPDALATESAVPARPEGNTPGQAPDASSKSSRGRQTTPAQPSAGFGVVVEPQGKEGGELPSEQKPRFFSRRLFGNTGPGGERFSFPSENESQQEADRAFSPGSVRAVATPKSVRKTARLSDESDDTPDPERTFSTSLSGFSPLTSSRRFVWWGAAAGLVFIVSVIVLLSTVFNRATVLVQARVESLAIEDVAVSFDASAAQVNVSQKIIPAERLQFSRKVAREFQGTGSKAVEERAHAIARIYNRFSTAPQTLVNRTRFVTDKGAIYRLTKSVVVPGATAASGRLVPQFIEAELIADQPGEQANTAGETTLSIPGFRGSPKYEGFSAVAPSGFGGGFKGQWAILSDDDLKRAQEGTTKQAYNELKDEIAQKIPPGFTLSEQLREIRIAKLDTLPGSSGDKVIVEAVATGEALVFREEDVKQLLKNVILQNDATRVLVDGSSNLRYTPRSVNLESGRANVVVQGSLKTKRVVVPEELADLIKGKKEGSAKELLKAHDAVAAFNLSFFPPWLSKIPQNSGKVHIIADQPIK
ncbi:MAG: hypothetical protein HY006_01550 [Candidatus Sungbacteria bacterium]|nr:hypothetical protein [Candidatus Sungbacteria bacterium]